jgi:hypothetical protein
MSVVFLSACDGHNFIEAIFLGVRHPCIVLLVFF